MIQQEKIDAAVSAINNAKHFIAFTGAGISVESGIPPFRGPQGIWNQYDPNCLEIDNYLRNPKKNWPLVKEIFYDFFGKARPNIAHRTLASMEKNHILHAVITQNIDNLHQEAGSSAVYEFHGNSHTFVCTNCCRRYSLKDLTLSDVPPVCDFCHHLLKPDFVFFGEAIPENARTHSFEEALACDVLLIIGSTGEVMPACMIPQLAKQQQATIIEINPTVSYFTQKITNIFIQSTATEAMSAIGKQMKLNIVE